MANKLLHKIRNIGGKHAAYANAVRKDALQVIVDEPSFEGFLANLMVEDMRIPGHQNLGTTEIFRPQLAKIVSGESERWHLWEVRFYRHSFALHFLDREAKGRRRQVTTLKCYMEWPAELQMKILVPGGMPSRYDIVHLSPHDRFEYLTIRYENPGSDLENTETYAKGVRR